jgi:hypothetical protein
MYIQGISNSSTVRVTIQCPQGAWCDGKGFEICIAGLKFESGRAPLVRAWDNWSFTRSSRPTKYTFQEVRFPRIQKIKKKLPYSQNC